MKFFEQFVTKLREKAQTLNLEMLLLCMDREIRNQVTSKCLSQFSPQACSERDNFDPSEIEETYSHYGRF